MSYTLPLYFYQQFKEFPGSEYVGDRLWFMALEPLKASRLGSGYKGLSVMWYVGKRKPDKAKHASIHSAHASFWPWNEISAADVPPKVVERFRERYPEAPRGATQPMGGKRRHGSVDDIAAQVNHLLKK